MWIIWDILTVAIVLTFAAASYRKGFLHTVTRLVGSIGALLFSLVYSEPIARMIFDNYLRSSTLDLVAKNVGEFSQNGAEAFLYGLEGILDELPGWLSQSLEAALGSSAEAWYAQIQSSDAATLSAAITDTVIGPMATALVRVLVFFVLFTVLMLLVNTIAGLLKSVNFLPVIGSLNEILGGVLGAAQGLLYVFVFASLLWFIVSATGDGMGIISNSEIEKTFLFRWFYLAGPWASGIL